MKLIATLCFSLFCTVTLAATPFHFDKQPIDKIKNKLQRSAQSQADFQISNNLITTNKGTACQSMLKAKAPAFENKKTHHRHQRFQQYYCGLPVVGAEVVVHENKNALSSRLSNGTIVDNIDISRDEIMAHNDKESKKDAYDQVIIQFEEQHPDQLWQYKPRKKRLEIASIKGEAKLVYHISFYATSEEHAPILYHTYVDANDLDIVYKHWNGISYAYSTPLYAVLQDQKGVGGNEKTGKYFYGEEDIPALTVSRDANICYLENKKVRVVSLERHYIYDDQGVNIFKDPYQYECVNWLDMDLSFNGAYSVFDDALFFGELITKMYQDWYAVDVLPGKLILRVHARNPFKPDSAYYDNAFWNPEDRTMNFGDGDPVQFYPFVSLDVAAHEVGHGFSQNHANFENYDQSGSLNEAFSDMAAVTIKAYLKDTNAELYDVLYPLDNDTLWMIGSTIIRHGLAIRSISDPERDGLSADCFEEVDSCDITYKEVVEAAKKYITGAEGQYGFIVHHANGIFNKAFYNLSQHENWGIKKTFEVMLTANLDGYWTSGGLDQTQYFEHAAQGVVNAAKSLGYNEEDVKESFQSVGLLL